MMRFVRAVSERVRGVGHACVDVVRSPSYFPLWLGQLISNFGDTLHYVVLVYELTRRGGQSPPWLPLRSCRSSCSVRSAASSSIASVRRTRGWAPRRDGTRHSS